MSFVSCTFDKMFLIPTVLDRDLREINVNSIADSEPFKLILDNDFSPIFKDVNGNELYTNIDTESFFYENHHGKLIHAWHFKPKNNYNNISILFLHGNAGNVSSHFQLVLPLVKKGYKVLLPDYSGFGLSEGKAKIKNVKSDAEISLKFLNSIISDEDSKLVIYGQSLGGHLAAVIAAENIELIDGVIIEGAFTSHRDIAAHTTGLGFIARLLTRELYSAKESIQKISKPVLIIHSTQDAVIPYKMGKELYDLANQPKNLITIANKHILGPVFYTDTISEAIIQMVEQ